MALSLLTEKSFPKNIINSIMDRGFFLNCVKWKVGATGWCDQKPIYFVTSKYDDIDAGQGTALRYMYSAEEHKRNPIANQHVVKQCNLYMDRTDQMTKL